MKTELTQEILSLQPGDHLCLFYDRDPAEQMPALVPFIHDALMCDEQFIYIADDVTMDVLRETLAQNGVDVNAETAHGRLRLWTRQEWRQPGELASDRKAAQVRQFVQQATAAHFKGIRFAVEMTWTLGPDIEAKRLEHWEATVNTLFEPRFPARVICQYNRSRLAPEIMLAALHTHPVAILGEEVCPNFFYQAPMILNGGNGNGNGHAKGHSHGHANGNGKSPVASKVDWMVAELKRMRQGESRRQELLRQKRDGDAGRRLAAIVESSDDAIISKDLNSVVMSWNKGAERIFGYTAAEMIGRPISVLIPANLQSEEPIILERLRRGERIDHYETIRQRKDGRLVEISLSVSPVKDDEGTVIGASKIARDITERKQSERALAEAQLQLARAKEELEFQVQYRTSSLRQAIEQMEEFSYSVSHDLRAPLRAMQGYARVVVEDYGDRLGVNAREYLERIVRGATRMDRLIQDILTYSRLSRREVRLEEVSLDKLVREIVQQFPEMQPPHAEVVIDDPLRSVVGHEPSLTQAISNLLNNAVKFVEPDIKPRIRLHTEQHGADVRLWVEDNGIGIKPEHQSRLFGMFERIHPEKRYEGTGIGLAIVRKALERMNGQAGVESDGLTGSNFWLQLPAPKQT